MVTVNTLKSDERDAIKKYKKATQSSSGKSKRMFKHIQGEEQEHLKELKGLKIEKNKSKTKKNN